MRLGVAFPCEMQHNVLSHCITNNLRGEQRPAIALLSSGHESYPLNRPIAAVWDGSKDGKGRLLVVGSVRMADDDWLTKVDCVDARAVCVCARAHVCMRACA
jgi:hypothetical protein